MTRSLAAEEAGLYRGAVRQRVLEPAGCVKLEHRVSAGDVTHQESWTEVATAFERNRSTRAFQIAKKQQFKAYRSLRGMSSHGEPVAPQPGQRSHRQRRRGRAMKPGRRIPPHGELRRGQIRTTFGPGTSRSAAALGADWRPGLERDKRVYARLEGWLSDKLKTKSYSWHAPPIPSSEPQAPKSGIDVYQFPIWFWAKWKRPGDARGQVCRTRPLLPWNRLVKGGYLTRDRKIKPVVPVRFCSKTCVRGHISDIDWYGFVRHDYQTGRTGDLWMDEGGAGNDLTKFMSAMKRWATSGAGCRKRQMSAAARQLSRTQPWLEQACAVPCGSTEPPADSIRIECLLCADGQRDLAAGP